MKKCNECLEELPVERFGKNKNRKDGINTRCRICANLKLKAWRRIHVNITRYVPGTDIKLCKRGHLKTPDNFKMYRNSRGVCRKCVKVVRDMKKVMPDATI